MGAEVEVGPFSHLRPRSRLERAAHLGNFVETKNATLGEGAKANHLAYLGDIDVGARTNVGAGTIVCNYDGFAKWRSRIGEGAFIGSDSQIISPVTIGDGAYVATGSTVTADVPGDALAIGRSRQVNKEGYAVSLRERLREGAPKK
jgi:bifunctional UDP-N-acetylglucosamine pyrophosphorylase/glucosamine-1-phosphate N-acetyltransferase